jgi:glycosyltransferase involved in cell wall biosynthesis
MGRTEWDERVAEFFNPNIKYFHLNEVLRSPFYENAQPPQLRSATASLRIVSTLSPIIYKGMDVVLKTANLLRAETRLNFEWTILGISETDPLLRHFKRCTGLEPDHPCLRFIGAKSPEYLAGLLRESDLFVHPSYIDNSPNSVCEAQILGVPVIACNVGGLSSLIAHQQTGILVPANGVYELASWIIQLSRNPNLRQELGCEGRRQALIRHDRQAIQSALLEAYQAIREESQCNA